MSELEFQFAAYLEAQALAEAEAYYRDREEKSKASKKH